MIACLDVHYLDGGAVAAGIAFQDWGAVDATEEKVVRLPHVEPYQAGQFYRRELPCLLAVLRALPPVDTIIIDGYVWLEHGLPGLGAHLHEALQDSQAVVGVAKTRYRGADHVLEVLRGHSKRPLFVSAMGMDLHDAAGKVRSMYGEHRLPVLLKKVDALCRTGGQG